VIDVRAASKRYGDKLAAITWRPRWTGFVLFSAYDVVTFAASAGLLVRRDA
jgi:hypothetical protein